MIKDTTATIRLNKVIKRNLPISVQEIVDKYIIENMEDITGKSIYDLITQASKKKDSRLLRELMMKL